VLGLFDGMPYEEGKTQLQAGDLLVVFTDGISESWGEDDEEFGEDRLGELVKKHATKSAKELMETLQQEVDLYTKGSRPTDDCTLLIVKRN
jgi:sigma-B regulation protein RsbU (phosphoserine phosphatase)